MDWGDRHGAHRGPMPQRHRFDPNSHPDGEPERADLLTPGSSAVSRANNSSSRDRLSPLGFKWLVRAWHTEPGVSFLHVELTCLFDKYPGLQMILGHWDRWSLSSSTVLMSIFAPPDRPLPLRHRTYLVERLHKLSRHDQPRVTVLRQDRSNPPDQVFRR